MAFGFGFNKQKVLSAAEKFVQQGKLQNAIAEYDKVLKHDPKDLTVNNTIGDLYSRLGDSAKAIVCFKTVGDAYAAQGFTVKGIAMYKKITKLQPSVDSSLKLAELYTQQGLFNDARAQYLQVAEDFMKNGDLEQAVRLFQKVLEMDPENVPMRVKLAEVYVRLGKKKEAWEIFSAAAEALRSRGSLAGAEEILKRMLVLDPGNSYVLLLRGRAAVEGGDPKSAISYLEKASDLDSHPEGLRDLLKAYLQIGNVDKASPIAEKLLSVHNDPEGIFLFAEGCVRLERCEEALQTYTRHADRLLGADSTKLLASLHSMITRVRDNADALDTLLGLLNKAGESTHVNEVTELQAHACVKNENFTRARDLYQALMNAEPQNQVHTQNYQQVLDLIEASSSETGITPEEGAVIVEELEATAPVIDQSYPDEIAIAVRSAVTDADLFLSYNLPEKAIVPLLGALPQAPRDARLNQRLAALHTRFKRFTEAAVCCRTLESVYHDANYPDEAIRYGELAARYEQGSGTASRVRELPTAASQLSSRAAAATASTSASWPAAAPAASSAIPEFSLHEMAVDAPAEEENSLSAGLPAQTSEDASAEWESTLSTDEPAAIVKPSSVAGSHASDPNNPEISETVEEIRFYLEHFMTEQARSALEKLESLTSDAGILDPMRAALTSASQSTAESESDAIEINADDPAEFECNVESTNIPESGSTAAASEQLAGYDRADFAAPLEVVPPTFVDDDEPGFAQIRPSQLPATEAAQAEAAQAEVSHSEVAHNEVAHSDAGSLDSLVADLEASLGDSFPQADSTPAPARTNHSPASTPLPGWPVAAQPAVAKTQESNLPPVRELSSLRAPAASAPPASAPSASAPSASTPGSGITYKPSATKPLGISAPGMNAPGGIDLSEMFGELKQELEEDVAAGDEDPETHYNLGVAFREMGLLDEAIAELQKVCNSIERGVPFAQPVQTYTWLAQCFLDKGVPQAAISWYERALKIPNLDNEARLAINYELGSACESAMDKPAALRHFTDVYGANIDYRDVAERIQALKS
jgi:tetratricopeptide (TPR) repeat protein